jgi:hypothetical protein
MSSINIRVKRGNHSRQDVALAVRAVGGGMQTNAFSTVNEAGNWHVLERDPRQRKRSGSSHYVLFTFSSKYLT